MRLPASASCLAWHSHPAGPVSYTHLVVALYNSLGVYLPLITTNCCVLAVTILVVGDYGADVAAKMCIRDSLKAVRECGLVGLGGAGFPTDVKLQPKQQVDTLLINASAVSYTHLCGTASGATATCCGTSSAVTSSSNTAAACWAWCGAF